MAFRQCSSCSSTWATREEFLADSGVVLIGYRASLIDLHAGVFLFRHRCGSVMMMHAGEFVDLYHGPVFEERRTGSEECPAYCLRKEELRPCPVKCECAYVREVVQIVLHWPKQVEAHNPKLVKLGLAP